MLCVGCSKTVVKLSGLNFFSLGSFNMGESRFIAVVANASVCLLISWDRLVIVCKGLGCVGGLTTKLASMLVDVDITALVLMTNY